MPRHRIAVALVLSLAACSAPPAADSPESRAASALQPANGNARLVSKVEHFFATAPDAERLFHLFRDTLGLAEAWPYRSWGNFASGGVSLGNVAFELVYYTAPDGTDLATEFAGIALEPVAGTSELLAELAARGITHEPPDTTFTGNTSGERLGWINTGLPAWSAYGLFFCDYVPRDIVAAGRRAAAEQLAEAQGGALGVVAMREIRLGTPDLAAARTAWRQLIDVPTQDTADTFSFGDGPRVQLAASPDARILGIVLEVHSLDSARAYLADRGWLGATSTDQVTMAPEMLDGLRIDLVQHDALRSDG